MTGCIHYRIFGYKFAICFNDTVFETLLKFIYPHYVQTQDTFSRHVFYLSREKGLFLINVNGKEQFKTNCIKKLFSFLEWSITCSTLRESNQFLQLHAGCAVRNEEGIIFIGKSGAGKTTLVYHLIKGNLQCLGDDILFISPEERVVHPFKRAFLVKGGLKQILGVTDKYLAMETNKFFFCNDIVYIDPSIQYASCWSPPISKIKAVVFVNHSKDKYFSKVQKYLAAEWLLKASFNLNFVKNSACKVIADLLNKAQTFCLDSNNIEWSISRVNSIFDK